LKKATYFPLEPFGRIEQPVGNDSFVTFLVLNIWTPNVLIAVKHSLEVSSSALLGHTFIPFAASSTYCGSELAVGSGVGLTVGSGVGLTVGSGVGLSVERSKQTDWLFWLALPLVALLKKATYFPLEPFGRIEQPVGNDSFVTFLVLNIWNPNVLIAAKHSVEVSSSALLRHTFAPFAASSTYCEAVGGLAVGLAVGLLVGSLGGTQICWYTSGSPLSDSK